MPINEETMKHQVKKNKSFPVMMNQWGMLWNIINHAQQWWTNTGSETIQTILIKKEPVKHEVQQSNYAY